ncbi:hypothetical protein CYMTET_37929 [Cymbomonas tetramitiformis]|uniref:HAT C-terminal dimerisation domain-containing protein n=1 Tax=Cymbomonas tetramitiformis TaxID=36881 RepID=A0AAE0CF51_9CHLO|nr:hypothetical protein CYMTET_37929 [Cymbomonas tetramitiformis]
MFLTGTLTASRAIGWARSAWEKDWKPKGGTPVPVAPKPKEKATVVTLSDFMDNSDDEDEVVAIAAPFAEAIEHEDELVKYLALPLERAGCDLQEWWKTHKFRLPSLAKMAREFLAVPASTAGVERSLVPLGKCIPTSVSPQKKRPCSIV